MLETRWGECAICKQKRVLYSVVGMYRGKELWAGWICQECLEHQRCKDWGVKDDERSDKLS